MLQESYIAIPASANRMRLVLLLRDSLLNAIRSLYIRKTRSLLTLLGIVIAVVAVVTLVAIMKGVKSEINNQVRGLGANLVLVVPGKLDENGQPSPGAMIGLSTLTDQDIVALQNVPGVEKISPVSIIAGSVDYVQGKMNRTASAFVVATNREGVQMNPTTLSEGRYFNDGEDHVCIIGNRPSQQLFGGASPLGRSVRISQQDWKVVGVLSKPKADGTLGSSLLGLSTLVYLPVNTARHEIAGIQINRIALQTDYKHPADRMIARMQAALFKAHGNREDFGVITQEKGLAMVIRFVNLAQSLLVLIATISLVIAGIGIMNIMLVTVTERTSEIGLRKTVGARHIDIFLQFLLEAVVLCCIGGSIGLAISKISCLLIARFSPLKPLITPDLVAMAFAICLMVGIFFGVLPAMRAARLNPIDALRHQ